jgi:hypothetical protein
MSKPIDLVALLQPANSIGATPHTLIGCFEEFVKTTGILDLDDDPSSQLDLEPAAGDEQRLAKLFLFEQRCFVLGSLLQEVVRDELTSLEAATTDRISQIIRDERVSVAVAAHRVATSDTTNNSDKDYIGMVSLLSSTLLALYESSLRMRTQQWSKRIIVRKDFTAYTYG